MKKHYYIVIMLLLLCKGSYLVGEEPSSPVNAIDAINKIKEKENETIAEITEETEKKKEEKKKSKFLYQSEKPVEPKNKEERTKAAADDVNKMFEMLREFSSPPGTCPSPSNNFTSDTSLDGLANGSMEKIARLARDEIGHAFECSDPENGFTGCPVDNLKCAAQTSRLLIKAGVLEENEGSDAVVGVVTMLTSDKKNWKECPEPYMPGSVAYTNGKEEMPKEYRTSLERSHIGVVTVVNGRTGIVNNKGSEGGELGVDYEGEWFESVKFLCPPQ